MIINKPVKRHEKQLKITITLSQDEVESLSKMYIEDQFPSNAVPTIGSRITPSITVDPTVTLTSWMQQEFLTELVRQLRRFAVEYEI